MRTGTRTCDRCTLPRWRSVDEGSCSSIRKFERTRHRRRSRPSRPIRSGTVGLSGRVGGGCGWRRRERPSLLGASTFDAGQPDEGIAQLHPRTPTAQNVWYVDWAGHAPFPGRRSTPSPTSGRAIEHSQGIDGHRSPCARACTQGSASAAGSHRENRTMTTAAPSARPEVCVRGAFSQNWRNSLWRSAVAAWAAGAAAELPPRGKRRRRRWRRRGTRESAPAQRDSPRRLSRPAGGGGES